MRVRSRQGFTLIEVMVTVAIVAIASAMAIFMVTRNRERASLDRAMVELRNRIQRTQSLAMVAGSRLGTARLAFNASCAGVPPGNFLWIQVTSPTTVQIPFQIRYDNAADILRVDCAVFDVTAESGGNGVLDAAAVGTVFSFTGSGRVILPGGGTGPVFIAGQINGGNQRYGFRFLPSGVSCAATVAAEICAEGT